MFKKIIISLKFCRSILSIFINPFFLHRRALNIFIKKHSLSCKSNDVILDVGCGEMPYKDLFSHTKYIGTDILTSGRELNRKTPTFWSDGETIPLKENSCSQVLLIEVMEHIYNPDNLLSEVKRVLSSNGTLLITTPFFWPIHESPFDYKRYTKYSMHQLLEESGFNFVKSEETGNIFVSFFQTINSYLYFLAGKKLFILLLPLIIIFNFLGLILSLYTSKNNPFPLGYITMGRKC